MSEYSAKIGTTLMSIPLESLTDMTLGWMDSRKLLNKLPIKFLELKEGAFDYTVQSAARFVAAHVIYPRISTPFAIVNASIGILHVAVAASIRFRASENDEKTPQANWEEIALHVHKGFAHLITAAYDFWVGYFLSQKPYGLIGVAAFVIAPRAAAVWSERIFSKPSPEQSSTENVPVEEEIEREQMQSAQENQNILDPACSISKLAEKITRLLLSAKLKTEEKPE